MLDAVVRGMVTPPDEFEFTNTISGVLCISDKTVPTQLYPKEFIVEGGKI